jgi:hypothetical protein
MNNGTFDQESSAASREDLLVTFNDELVRVASSQAGNQVNQMEDGRGNVGVGPGDVQQ